MANLLENATNQEVARMGITNVDVDKASKKGKRLGQLNEDLIEIGVYTAIQDSTMVDADAPIE